MATDYSDPINLAESLRQLACVSYWKVLQRRLDEFEKHRADSAHWYEQARNAHNEGHKSEPWIAMAEESERTAEKYHHLMLEQESSYGNVCRALELLMPESIGDLPLVDGQDCRSVSPADAAKAMRGILGGFIALANNTPVTFEEHCEKCESQGLGHMETAAAWLASHPEEPRDCEQVKKASKNYRAK